MNKNGFHASVGTLAIALLGALPPSHSPAVEASPAVGPQWLNYANRLDGQRFSTLSEMTSANIAQLGEVCRQQIDGPTSFTAGLIVAGGVIYTNTGRQTVALDAATCAIRWKHTYIPDEEEVRQSSRGVAVLDGRVFRGTGDGRLIALDAATGILLWKNVIGSPRLNEFASAAPLAWNGVVYMGVGGGDAGIRGRIMAFDAATGHELWRFNTIPMGKEFGANTWTRPGTAKTGGGGVWGAMSLDVSSGELFVPVGNPWPDLDADYRPGENLFTDSILVLNAHSGALMWWYQTNPQDSHDVDLSAPPVLYRDSKIRDIVAFAGKGGYVYGIDRENRKLLFKTAVNRMENEGKKATHEGVHICPGFDGGVEWNGPTLDPVQKTLITGSVDWCYTIFLGPVVYSGPQKSYGGTRKPDEQAIGWVTALDSESGEIRWRYQAERPVIAGVTPTAGGLTFTGDTAGNFLVLDSKDGTLLRKIPTGGALAGGVVTYETANKQYIAFASGNVSRATFGELGLPTVIIMALNPSAASSAATTPRPSTVEPAKEPDASRGSRLFGQICAACHGADGDTLADHRLSTVASRRDLQGTVRFIKDPNPPMPKMFPRLLTDQDVLDVAAYVQQGLARKK